jgi:L-lactate dehydrogenase complex protein LldG
MNRDDFLRRVRAAAASGRQYRVHAHERAYGKFEPTTRAELYERFGAEVTAVGGHFHRMATGAELSALIRTLVERDACRQAIVWRHASLEQHGVYEILESLDVAWFDAERLAALSNDARRTSMLSAALGVTAASAAVAETGSIVVQSRFGQERSASLLPPVHLAIVDTGLLLPDLFDYFAHLGADAPHRLPSNATVITGPSKTGDLELRLVTGVHGPRQWHVALCGS